MNVRDLLRTKILAAGGFAIVADRLGCTRELLYQYCSHNSPKTPGLKKAFELEQVVGLPAALWAVRGAA